MKRGKKKRLFTADTTIGRFLLSFVFLVAAIKESAHHLIFLFFPSLSLSRLSTHRAQTDTPVGKVKLVSWMKDTERKKERKRQIHTHIG